MSQEPARIIGYLTTAIGAIITLLVAFGAPIDDDQRNAILAAVGTVVPVVIIMIEVIRAHVISPNSAGTAVGLAKGIDPATNVIPELTGVSGFKDAAAHAAGMDTRDVKWKPPVASH